MTAKKRSAHKVLPQVPLSELPMMKALLLIPPAVDKTTRQRAIKGSLKSQLTTLTLTIVDKLQVLALRRPQALVNVAKVLDKLLDQQLEGLVERKQVESSATKTGAEYPRRSRPRDRKRPG